MRAERIILGLALASLTLLAAGCGGGGGAGGPPLSAQYADALANANPESSAAELTRIAYAFKSAGDAGSAERAANDAARKAEQIKDATGRGMAFRDIATAQGFLGMRQETKASLKQAQAAAEKIESPDGKAEVLGQVGVVYGNYLNDPNNAKYWLDEAKKSVDSATDPDRKARGLIAVAYSYNKWKSDEGKGGSEQLTQAARDTAATVPDASGKADVLGEIAVKLEKMKKGEEAKKVFDEALAVVRAIPDAGLKTHGLCGMAEKMAATRNAEARALLDEAEKVKETITDPSLKNEASETISRLKKQI